MSFLRGTSTDGRGGFVPVPRTSGPYEEERRVARSDRVGTGTLACDRCDAPVALGPSAIVPTDTLSCPFCGHQAPARDFLSLASPARPARVAVRLRLVADLS